MITLAIILSLLLLILLWALFVPFNITINTTHNYYRLFIPGLIGVRLIKKEGNMKVKGNFLFFRFNIDRTGKKKEKSQVKKKRKKRSVAPNAIPILIRESIYTLKKTIRSIQVKRLNIELDTGDFPLNAQLFPIAIAINNKHHSMIINFENRNSLDMLIFGQIYKILFYGLRFYFKTKYLFIKN